MYTAFAAARLAAHEGRDGQQVHVAVATGHWGTGAFRNNKTLLMLLQLLAAHLARIDTLVVYASSDRQAVELAEVNLQCLTGSGPIKVSAMMQTIWKHGFVWQ